ncbi:acyl-CoA dehydrogenase family protein, partial [Streptomyces prunicolor]|uniref:acyl-CoA dehydrogenase family protein n=1 Tax=Streptomyces prunicolor TaxID=67348 RepID=UPI003410DFFA
MDLVLSADQKLFRATVKGFLEKEAPLTRVRELADTSTGFDRDWWSRAAELGWTAMLVSEELGGGSVSGDGLLDLAIVAEEFGRGVGPGPLLATNIVLAGLAAATDGPDHSHTVEALVSGESVATWAVYEPGGQWSPLTPGLTAKPGSDGFVLDGVKDRVELAEQADLFLVTATTEQGLAQFLVPADAAGVSVEASRSLDLVRRFAEVRFAGVGRCVPGATSRRGWRPVPAGAAAGIRSRAGRD